MAGERQRSIVLIGTDVERLRAIVQGVPSAPRVRIHPELYSALADLAVDPPSSLWLDVEPLAEEDLGALRALRRLLPETALVLCAPRSALDHARFLAAALGAEVLERPFRTREVLGALGPRRAPEAGARRAAGGLVRGVADELGNPLLFAAGHLRLVAASLGEPARRDVAEKLALLQAGLDRMAATIERLRTLVEPPRPVARPCDPVELLREAVQAAAAGPRAAARGVQVRLAQPGGTVKGPGVGLDPEVFTRAAGHLLAASVELAEHGAAVEVTAGTRGRFLVLRLHLPCTLPATVLLEDFFEPYALWDRLRGSGAALDPALARALFVAQGGTVAAMREGEGALVLEAVVPAGPLLPH